MSANPPLIHQESPKTLMAFITVMMGVYLLVGSYQFYKKTEFQTGVRYLYGENHYKLRQMASADILCRDSEQELCFCGHCS